MDWYTVLYESEYGLCHYDIKAYSEYDAKQKAIKEKSEIEGCIVEVS